MTQPRTKTRFSSSLPRLTPPSFLHSFPPFLPRLPALEEGASKERGGEEAFEWITTTRRGGGGETL